MEIPPIWQLLNRFKEQCQLRSWKTSEHEDWVKIGDEYHNFLWTQRVHPSTFEKITLSRKCAIRRESSYQVVDVSYIAWLLSQGPPDHLLEILKENPELARRTAIFDLSQVFAGKPLCLKLNKTESIVFKEFEKFLAKLGVSIKPTPKVPTQQI